MEPCSVNHHQDDCSQGAALVARIQAGPSLEVLLLYWATHLTLVTPNWPLT